MATISPWLRLLEAPIATLQQFLSFCISLGACRSICGLLGGLFLLAAWPAFATAAPPDAEVFIDSPFRFKKASQQQVSMEYKAHGNLLIIPVFLNGKGPYNFLLDTGIATSLITNPKLGRQLGVQTTKAYNLSGVGKKAPVLAHRTNSVRVEFAGIEAPSINFIIVTKQVVAFEALLGIQIHGILGYDLFRSFIVSIHPTLGQITFTEPTAPRPTTDDSWSSLPIELDDSRPYITTNISLTGSQAIPLRLMLDTGANHALSLETASDPRLSLPPERQRADLGYGFSGLIQGYLGPIALLQLGAYQLRSLLTAFPDPHNLVDRVTVPRSGTLGFDVLRRFDLIIDYPHNRLLLRPNSDHREQFEQASL
ncbi:pepsin/retropepsin-like aspartic protease family protein [Hymenobacter qilianensis]|uniref:Aspartyl protease family protein n=2 Tax=Hymenobacter qilianensis TaxID=1385715 RepID=A0A7H0GTI6_9BACT|nr:pepsin/retropepsin-like aspartic protease family protein [Hymenobacter qilianensis]QNP51602.1 aspartyl protease family protein [Hymenobacter qilianensis]